MLIFILSKQPYRVCRRNLISSFSRYRTNQLPLGHAAAAIGILSCTHLPHTRTTSTRQRIPRSTGGRQCSSFDNHYRPLFLVFQIRLAPSLLPLEAAVAARASGPAVAAPPFTSKSDTGRSRARAGAAHGPQPLSNMSTPTAHRVVERLRQSRAVGEPSPSSISLLSPALLFSKISLCLLFFSR